MLSTVRPDDRRAGSPLVRSSRWQRGTRIWPGACALHHHDLRHHVRVGDGDRARSTSARASPTPTAPRSCARSRSPPSGRGATSTRPGNGIPELRQAVAAHQRAWYGLELDPETEVLVTVGATEAIAATLLALCEPGDEVVMFEPTYDSYAAVRGHGRRRAAAGPPAPARLVLRPRRAGRRRRAPHQARAAQLAAQPDRQGVLAGRAGAGRRPLCRPRPPGGDRRGLRAPGLRRVARPAGHPARHARPHPHHLVGRQDVLLHRVEGGLGERPRAAGRRGAGGQAVPDLHQPGPVPAGHRPRPRVPARRHGAPRRRARGPARPAL